MIDFYVSIYKINTQSSGLKLLYSLHLRVSFTTTAHRLTPQTIKKMCIMFQK